MKIKIKAAITATGILFLITCGLTLYTALSQEYWISYVFIGLMVLLVTCFVLLLETQADIKAIKKAMGEKVE